MTAPTWQPVDEQTGNLLDFLADDGTAQREAQFAAFVAILRHVAKHNDGAISPNDTRVHTRAEIDPPRVGPFFRRAQLEGLIVAAGWAVSDDAEGKNAGRPARTYRWIGES